MSRRGWMLMFPACLFLLIATGGCDPSNETVTSLVDLFSSTSGSLVEIFVKAAINGLLTMGQTLVDLSAPISSQFH